MCFWNSGMPRNILKKQKKKRVVRRRRERGTCIRHAVIKKRGQCFHLSVCFPKPSCCTIHRYIFVCLEFACVLHEHSPAPRSLTSDTWDGHTQTHAHTHIDMWGFLGYTVYNFMHSQTVHCPVELGSMPVFFSLPPLLFVCLCM